MLLGSVTMNNTHVLVDRDPEPFLFSVRVDATRITGCGKSGSFYCINYRCKESELLGLPLCVLCFSIFSVVLSIEHFQFALILFLRLDSSHVILNDFNSHCSLLCCGSALSPLGGGALTCRNEAVEDI